MASGWALSWMSRWKPLVSPRSWRAWVRRWLARMAAMSGASCCGLRGGDCEGLGVLREGVEAEGGLGDDGEGAEASR